MLFCWLICLYLDRTAEKRQEIRRERMGEDVPKRVETGNHSCDHFVEDSVHRRLLYPLSQSSHQRFMFGIFVFIGGTGQRIELENEVREWGMTCGDAGLELDHLRMWGATKPHDHLSPYQTLFCKKCACNTKLKSVWKYCYIRSCKNPLLCTLYLFI